MSLAALARQMHEAGTPMEGILLALEALEARDSEAAQKRARVAARKQAQRDRERDSHATVTGQSGDSPAPSPFLPPDPQPTPTPTRMETPRARKGTRLADDWRPTTLKPDTVSGEIVARRGQDWARKALESFKNHWRSANGPTATKRDWQAAWANWIIEQDNRDGRRNGTILPANGRGASTSGMGPTVDAAERFLARRGAC